MLKILVSTLMVFFLSGCDQLKIETQINEKQIEVEDLKIKNQVLNNEVRALSSQVARLNVDKPDGAVVEELRKALTHKETVLELRKERYLREEESLRLLKINLSEMRKRFYSETGEKLQIIGEAKQIRKEYDHMQEKLDDATERANHWLIFIAILGIGFFGAILSLLNTGIKYSRQNRDIDSALKFVEEGELNHQDKKLMASYLGKRLT